MMKNVFSPMFHDPFEVVRIAFTKKDTAINVYREKDYPPVQETYNLGIYVTKDNFTADYKMALEGAKIGEQYADDSFNSADLIMAHFNQRTNVLDGFCLVKDRETPDGEKYLYVSLIVTHTKMAMNGLGIAMIRFVEYLRDELNYDKVRLGPVDVESVKGWYTYLGYKEDTVYNKKYVIPKPATIIQNKVVYNAEVNYDALMWYSKTDKKKNRKRPVAKAEPIAKAKAKPPLQRRKTGPAGRPMRRTIRGLEESGAFVPYFIPLETGETAKAFYKRMKKIPGVEYQGVIKGTNTAMVMADHPSHAFTPIYPPDDIPDELHEMYKLK